MWLAGAAFLTAFASLYAAEGPGTPDVPVTLAQSGGQQLFYGLVTAGTIAVLLTVVGMATLFVHFRATAFYPMLLVMVLDAMAGAIFIGFLSLHYGLAIVGKEGTDPTDPAFRELSILAHAAADLGGWTSIAIFALSTLTVSLIAWAMPRWRVVTILGLLAVSVAPVLYILNSSYLFTVPFGVWEVALAATMVAARR